MLKKRYEYWASENGKPIKKWTEFFPWHGDCPKYQLKSSRLLNEYTED